MTKRRGVTIIELVSVFAIFALVITLLTPFVHMAKERRSRIECEKNLRKISLGLRAYAVDHEEAFPDKLSELYPTYTTDRAEFDCPASKKYGTPDKPDYRYTPGLKALSPAKSVVVEDIDGNHGKKGAHILRVDGSIDWVRSAA